MENNWKTGFIQGYACAVANLIRGHGAETEAEDVYKENFLTVDQLREYGVDEFDIEALEPMIKEILRKRKFD